MHHFAANPCPATLQDGDQENQVGQQLVFVASRHLLKNVPVTNRQKIECTGFWTHGLISEKKHAA